MSIYIFFLNILVKKKDALLNSFCLSFQSEEDRIRKDCLGLNVKTVQNFHKYFKHKEEILL